MKGLKSQAFYFKAIHILLPSIVLFVGGLFYIFFRHSDFVFFKWIEYLGLGNWLIKLKEFTYFNPILPDWFIYSLPSGLWACAYTFIIVVIWYESHSLMRYFWYGSVPVLIFGFEFLQHVNIIPGAFSIGDILLSVAGLVIGILIGTKSIKHKNHGIKT